VALYALPIDPGFMVCKERNTAIGTGIRTAIRATAHPRRSAIKDRRDMCSHRSTDIKVKRSNAIAINYVALASAIVSNVIFNSGLLIA